MQYFSFLDKNMQTGAFKQMYRQLNCFGVTTCLWSQFLLIKNIRFIWRIDYIFECAFHCLALQLLNKNTFHGNKTLRLFSVSSEKKKKSSVLFGNSYFYNDCVIKGSQVKLFKDMALTWGLQISIKLKIFTEISY